MRSVRRSAAQLRSLSGRLAREGMIRNNAIFFIGGIGAGLFGYVFHFAVGRLLGPSAYGVVAAAIAALYLFGLPALAMQIVGMRFASRSGHAGSLTPLGYVMRRLAGVNLGIGAVLAAALLLARDSIARYLQISDRGVVAVLSVSAAFALLVAGNRGILQGLRRFAALSGNMILDAVIRLVTAIILVLLGLGAVGAVLGLLAGPAIAYGQTFVLLREHRRQAAQKPISLMEVGSYAGPAAVAVTGVTILFNADVLLAKHFLPVHAAGLYAAGAVLGRVVYFLGASVAGVMFPEVATRHARDEEHFHVVDLSLLFLALVGGLLTAVYFVLPGLVLLPYGHGFGEVAPYLAPFALALTLLSLGNLLISYFLSVDSRRFVIPLGLACVLEVWLIASFHRDPGQVVAMLVITMAALGTALAALYSVDRFHLFAGAQRR